MSVGKRRLDSRVFASAEGRQLRQPSARSRNWGRYRPLRLPRVAAPAPIAPAPIMAGDEVLPTAGCALEARPHVPKSRCRRLLISSSNDLMPSNRYRADSLTMRPTSALGDVQHGTLAFHSGRDQARRQVAGHSPSALCPIVASCIVIIHNKKRWRKWAGRCPARLYS